MAFTPKRGDYYRMPVFFGPTPGPRQFRGLERFDWQVQPRRRVLGARFLTDASKLQSWLPPGFKVWGPPIVTCEVTYFDGFGWLAGRGYNMCDLKFNAVYQNAAAPVHGTLLNCRRQLPILSTRACCRTSTCRALASGEPPTQPTPRSPRRHGTAK
jgi:hypothetical protein